MTAPDLAFTGRDGRRSYPMPPGPGDTITARGWDGALIEGARFELISASNAAKALPEDKSKLDRWKMKVGLERLADKPDLLDMLSVDELTDVVMRASQDHSSSVADRGTQLHLLCERYCEDGSELEVDDEEVMQAFGFCKDWIDKNVEEVIAQERTCYNVKIDADGVLDIPSSLFVAGTGDLFCRVAGRTTILDFKSKFGKNLHQLSRQSQWAGLTWATQLAIYGLAEWWASEDGLRLEPKPVCDLGIILTVSGYGLVEHVIDFQEHGDRISQLLMVTTQAARIVRDVAPESLFGPMPGPSFTFDAP